ncbi:tol-pal system-associated acyl-CoA thioesterase [Pararhodospirillum oryzae]|uniref:4-hydroxybenzoyl-CoA thioesterase n=1 Tax=Pararhodospirillum oryzae TaxID=478448 RepID=A0A512HBU6_9PROT|nr:tol-pal system-associated acyl-CoA thioesterase [Pararhodospirillum oryzae]GEO82915.1 4-hydroxybenzoyl-CoA thioesterase [Pararhodospirillum oryzae]
MPSAPQPSSGVWHGDAHLFPVRVHWENTDAGGIVYHSQYLNFAERARTEMLRLLGISQRALLDAGGLAFAVARLTIDYRRPARLDDALIVETRVAHVGGAILDLDQTIRRDDEDLARLAVRVACLSMAAGTPARLPAALRGLLTGTDQKRRLGDRTDDGTALR